MRARSRSRGSRACTGRRPSCRTRRPPRTAVRLRAASGASQPESGGRDDKIERERGRTWEAELCQLAAAAQVVLVLVGLAQAGPVAAVVGVLPPALLRGVGREAAVGALERDVDLVAVLVLRDGAVGELADAVALCAHLGEGRLGQGVEEVVLGEEGLGRGCVVELCLAPAEEGAARRRVRGGDEGRRSAGSQGAGRVGDAGGHRGRLCACL